MSCFNAELCRQAEDEVQTLRESNIEESQIIREQNTRLCPEEEIKRHRKKATKLEKLMRYIKEHQERGMHSDWRE